MDAEERDPVIMVGLDQVGEEWRPFAAIHHPCNGEPHDKCVIVQKYIYPKSFDLENAKEEAIKLGNVIAKAYGTNAEFVTGSN